MHDIKREKKKEKENVQADNVLDAEIITLDGFLWLAMPSAWWMQNPKTIAFRGKTILRLIHSQGVLRVKAIES